jgi:hypothetical protein
VTYRILNLEEWIQRFILIAAGVSTRLPDKADQRRDRDTRGAEGASGLGLGRTL